MYVENNARQKEDIKQCLVCESFRENAVKPIPVASHDFNMQTRQFQVRRANISAGRRASTSFVLFEYHRP